MDGYKDQELDLDMLSLRCALNPQMEKLSMGLGPEEKPGLDMDHQGEEVIKPRRPHKAAKM